MCVTLCTSPCTPFTMCVRASACVAVYSDAIKNRRSHRSLPERLGRGGLSGGGVSSECCITDVVVWWGEHKRYLERRPCRKRGYFGLSHRAVYGLCCGALLGPTLTPEHCGRIITSGGDTTLHWILYFVTVRVGAAL